MIHDKDFELCKGDSVLLFTEDDIEYIVKKCSKRGPQVSTR